jgi:hypothetical protein
MMSEAPAGSSRAIRMNSLFAGRAITSMSESRALRIMSAAWAIPRGWCSRSIHKQLKPSDVSYK